MVYAYIAYSYLFQDKRTSIFIVCYRHSIFAKYPQYLPDNDNCYGIFPTDISSIADI